MYLKKMFYFQNTTVIKNKRRCKIKAKIETKNVIFKKFRRNSKFKALFIIEITKN